MYVHGCPLLPVGCWVSGSPFASSFTMHRATVPVWTRSGRGLPPQPVLHLLEEDVLHRGELVVELRPTVSQLSRREGDDSPHLMVCALDLLVGLVLGPAPLVEGPAALDVGDLVLCPQSSSARKDAGRGDAETGAVEEEEGVNELVDPLVHLLDLVEHLAPPSDPQAPAVDPSGLVTLPRAHVHTHGSRLGLPRTLAVSWCRG